MAAIFNTKFQMHFLNENKLISIKISLKFIPNYPINNILALVPIMTWYRQCDKLLSELMMIILLARICVPWPKGVKSMSCRQP